MRVELEEHMVEMQGNAYVARLVNERDAWWINVYRNILIQKHSPAEAMSIFRAGRKHVERINFSRYDLYKC